MYYNALSNETDDNSFNDEDTVVDVVLLDNGLPSSQFLCFLILMHGDYLNTIIGLLNEQQSCFLIKAVVGPNTKTLISKWYG